MTDRLDKRTRARSRILLHSQRNLFRYERFRLGLYEFEDIIRQVDAVDLLTPQPKDWFNYGTRIANRLASTFKTSINPGIRKTTITNDYDLFLSVVQFPKDLLHVKYVDGWKDHCKVSICWLSEIWIPDIVKTEHFLEILSQFDYVVLAWAGSVAPLQAVVNAQCRYLNNGIDAIFFCPYPHAPDRVIDVYSIGRRSEVTHRALARMARERDFFYVHDTLEGSQVANADDHRCLFANMAKRSRYFIVNPAKADVCEETGGQIEFGSRFFEGAASGTIMIGETPRNGEFSKAFDWPNAVIDLPFGSDRIDTIIDAFDKEPCRQELTRRNNIVHSLLRHDWVYRWEAILRLANLDPMPELAERKKRLERLSAIVPTALAREQHASLRRR